LARGRAAVETPLKFDLGYYGNLFLADLPMAEKGSLDAQADSLT